MRFVCISDTHTFHQHIKHMPPADVLASPFQQQQNNSQNCLLLFFLVARCCCMQVISQEWASQKRSAPSASGWAHCLTSTKWSLLVQQPPLNFCFSYCCHAFILTLQHSPGNHDLLFDAASYPHTRRRFHREPYDCAQAKALLKNCTYLEGAASPRAFHFSFSTKSSIQSFLMMSSRFRDGGGRNQDLWVTLAA